MAEADPREPETPGDPAPQADDEAMSASDHSKTSSPPLDWFTQARDATWLAGSWLNCCLRLLGQSQPPDSWASCRATTWSTLQVSMGVPL